MEELVYKLIFCEGLGIVGKWRLIHFAMKFDYTDFNIDEVIKITNTSGNKGVLKESWQTLTTEWLQENAIRKKVFHFFQSYISLAAGRSIRGENLYILRQARS